MRADEYVTLLDLLAQLRHRTSFDKRPNLALRDAIDVLMDELLRRTRG